VWFLSAGTVAASVLLEAAHPWGNGNNCGGANHAAQNATIYGFHDFPPVPPHPSSSTREFDASSTEEWRGAQHRARRSVEGLARDQRR